MPSPSSTQSTSTETVLDAQTVFALRFFRHENGPRWGVPTPVPSIDGPEATHAELRELLVFAGRALGNGNPGLPLHLEARRVLSLVPDAVGAALFAEPACTDCGGAGQTVQGWTDKNGFSEDQYGPCVACFPGR